MATGKTNALVGGGGGTTEPTAAELLTGTISYFSESTIMSLKSYAFYNCSVLSQCTLNSSAYYIESYAFYNCSNLLNLSCLSTGNLTNVGQSAFAWCAKLSTNISVRSAYNFSIGSYAFMSCSSLTSVSLYTSSPGNNYIGSSAFANCVNLSNIYISTPFIDMSAFAFANTAIPFIDDSINFNPANSITGAYAIQPAWFMECSLLSYAKFQSSIYTTVGQSAFMSCTSLKSFYGVSIHTLYASAFRYCKQLENLYLPIISSMYSMVFDGCSSLKSFSASTIKFNNGSAIFRNCFSLEYLNLVNTSTHIGSTMFGGCFSLKYVNMRKVIAVSSTAFYNCFLLRSLMFTTSSAFRIAGSNNFQSCSRLESVYLFTTSTITMSNANAFGLTPLSTSSYLGYYGSIYVRQSLLSSYQTTTNWALYSDRMVGLTDEQVNAIISAYDAVTYEDVVGE